MKFVLKPSLEYIALVKIVTSLWNQDEVRELILEGVSNYQYSSIGWEKIEKRVRKKVSKIPIPQLLKEKVLDFIKPIGKELQKWMEFNFTNHKLPAHLPVEFCWTLQGTVDRKKTAELLVKDDSLDNFIHYLLSCIYCLEDHIHEFWNIMPGNMKKMLCQNQCKKPAMKIIASWSLYMKGKELGNAQMNYKYEFQQAVFRGNRVAAEYFFQKLTPQEKEKFLEQAECSVKHKDVLYFVISQMNEEQQKEFLKEEPFKVLSCFLEWPLQTFFLEIANSISEYLSIANYDYLLCIIAGRCNAGYKDCNYQKLFREFWQKSPRDLKSLFENEILNCDILPSLFNRKDEEKMRLIFKDISFTAKKKLIYGFEMNSCWITAIHHNRWDFLHFIVKEVFPSKSEMLKFKEEFEKREMFPAFKISFEAKKHNWDNLFCISDKINSRNADEGESSSSKRLRSLQ